MSIGSQIYQSALSSGYPLASDLGGSYVLSSFPLNITGNQSPNAPTSTYQIQVGSAQILYNPSSDSLFMRMSLASQSATTNFGGGIQQYTNLYSQVPSLPTAPEDINIIDVETGDTVYTNTGNEYIPYNVIYYGPVLNGSQFQLSPITGYAASNENIDNVYTGGLSTIPYIMDIPINFGCADGTIPGTGIIQGSCGTSSQAGYYCIIPNVTVIYDWYFSNGEVVVPSSELVTSGSYYDSTNAPFYTQNTNTLGDINPMFYSGGWNTSLSNGGSPSAQLVVVINYNLHNSGAQPINTGQNAGAINSPSYFYTQIGVNFPFSLNGDYEYNLQALAISGFCLNYGSYAGGDAPSGWTLINQITYSNYGEGQIDFVSPISHFISTSGENQGPCVLLQSNTSELGGMACQTSPVQSSPVQTTIGSGGTAVSPGAITGIVLSGALPAGAIAYGIYGGFGISFWMYNYAEVSNQYTLIQSLLKNGFSIEKNITSVLGNFAKGFYRSFTNFLGRVWSWTTQGLSALFGSGSGASGAAVSDITNVGECIGDDLEVAIEEGTTSVLTEIGVSAVNGAASIAVEIVGAIADL